MLLSLCTIWGWTVIDMMPCNCKSYYQKGSRKLKSVRLPYPKGEVPKRIKYPVSKKMALLTSTVSVKKGSDLFELVSSGTYRALGAERKTKKKSSRAYTLYRREKKTRIETSRRVEHRVCFKKKIRYSSVISHQFRQNLRWKAIHLVCREISSQKEVELIWK